MSDRKATRILPKAPTIEIPEEPSLTEMKRKLPVPELVQTTCSSSSAAQAEAQDIDVPSSPGPEKHQGPESLPPELIYAILGCLGSMREVMQLRSELGKLFKDAIHQPAFRRNRPHSEGEFSPTYLRTDGAGDLHWQGYDTLSKEWRTLPSLNFVREIFPSPDPDLFKDYLVASHGGLLCFDVGKATGREQLVMCNPLTRQVKILPPLKYARNPVLMHLKVDHASGHYKVFVAGSAAIGTETLSLKTEEYDSSKGLWECPDGSDLPCPAFGLNEYQNGVYFKDGERELLMCIAIIGASGRGVLVYDLAKKTWAQGAHFDQLFIPLVRGELNADAQLASSQITECGGFVFVFSEQLCSRDEVYFVLHKLILNDSGDFTLDEVMKHKRTGGRGLHVYPEFTCVPVTATKLGLFSTVSHTMEIIDLSEPMGVTILVKAPTAEGNRCRFLNPSGSPYHPSFRILLCPGRSGPKTLCDPQREKYCSECQRACSTSVGSGSDRNVGPNMINYPAIIAPAEETDMTTDHNELDFLENALNHLEFVTEVFDFLDEVGR